ncbi:hypothetical protein GCM10011581_14100 [Saccharopolyspora subtropica]|uniref:Secreted protein n=1 Tax=Saccharopolyspora thermophila TaxID=89367 RepID=A0A917JQ54_9PSEU|nr:hypothetical protein [Saccharopolyspora subtropica]GGI78192.1 hypothetical protein GCM10011581_14100 [Saccharopolyspora subtropica]
MRTAKRVIAATALGLPLLLGAPGMALADGDHHGHGKPCHEKCDGKHGKKKVWVQDQDLSQDQHASTDQQNHNSSPIYQWSVGSKGDQNALNWVAQDNSSSTDQVEVAAQEQEQEEED